MDLSDLKEQVVARIDARRADLIALSRNMQSHPETAFQEHQAIAWLMGELKQLGYAVESGVADLPTAFVGTLSSGRPGPCIGIIAEYDALPGVGHGCGHNLIAASAMGAAMGVAAAMPTLPGTVKVFGTPAEDYTEGRAGKLLMLDKDVFAGVDACLFFHPLTRSLAPRRDLGFIIVEATFGGRPAHAAADPWNGLNALDGVFLAYSGLSAMRQQMHPEARVHFIVTQGGEAVNIIPSQAALRIMFRSPDSAYLDELNDMIVKVLQGAAQASRTSLVLKQVTRILNTKFNPALCRLVTGNLAAVGEQVQEQDFLAISGDFGNLSQAVPSFYFTLQTHPPGTNWHSHEVANLAISDGAHEAMLQAAKGIGMSVVDLLRDVGLVAEIAQHFASG